jgi:hypothetical protein
MRIMAPSHASFQPGGANANYLQSYIDSMWAKYRNEDLVFTLQDLGTFRGRVSGDRFTFTGGSPDGTFYINGKPTPRWCSSAPACSTTPAAVRPTSARSCRSRRRSVRH